MDKVQSFTNLQAWRKGHLLVLIVYKFCSKFPDKEKFALCNQISRAVVSITSNIAEGFSRSSSKEKLQFYYTALGSLTEVQNQLLIARDLKYINPSEFKEAADLSVEVNKLIHGLIKAIKNKTLSS